jgi:hypothetical protein
VLDLRFLFSANGILTVMVELINLGSLIKMTQKSSKVLGLANTQLVGLLVLQCKARLTQHVGSWKSGSLAMLLHVVVGKSSARKGSADYGWLCARQNVEESGNSPPFVIFHIRAHNTELSRGTKTTERTMKMVSENISTNKGKWHVGVA